ncbi:N-glycosylation protein-domain-containing protein [Bisporella sp. PMI_857]|nr:N-glycosylation protein-domain-containing protein [Bisporella sp. PMI_857]
MGELLAEEMVGGVVTGAPWSVERRFRVTEVFLAVLWCSASAYLSWVFTDCLMSRWLLYYTPPASLVRLLSVNAANAYVTSWVLFLSGGSQDPRLLLPAWISIATTLTLLYHITHPRLAILKETSLSMAVFLSASFTTMVSLLLQLHLTRTNDPPVPLFAIARTCWEWIVLLAERIKVAGREL